MRLGSGLSGVESVFPAAPNRPIFERELKEIFFDRHKQERIGVTVAKIVEYGAVNVRPAFEISDSSARPVVVVRHGMDFFKGVHLLPNVPAQAGRGNDVRLQTEVRSRPCLQPDGWAVSWLLPRHDACSGPAESSYGDERRDITRKTGRIAHLPDRLPVVSYDEDISKIELRLVDEGTGRRPTINLEMNHEAEQTNNQQEYREAWRTGLSFKCRDHLAAQL
jgi:hypothetical protein